MRKQSINKRDFVSEKDFRKRKIAFWMVLAGFIISGLMYWLVLPLIEGKKERVLIRVGICGAVNVPAVYSMKQGSDLGMLIHRGGGLMTSADLQAVNLDQIVLNDSIYHIPSRPSGLTGVDAKQLTDLMRRVSDPDSAASQTEMEIRKYSILYVGLPAVYVLITYYPEFKRIQFTHIPHSTLFLNTDYRLIDLFYTFDIQYTVQVVENCLKQKIDYYLIQDRFAFMDLIDLLGGVNCKLDGPYAKAYSLKPGAGHLDGFHAWEFIRFMDLKRMKDFEVRELELAYEMRHHRQRIMLNAMRTAFRHLDTKGQMEVITNFKEVFKTNMDRKFLLSLYKDILSVPDFSFASLPGYYSNEKERLFFYPDVPGYKLLLKKEIRTNLEKRGNKKQIVY